MPCGEVVGGNIRAAAHMSLRARWSLTQSMSVCTTADL
jgi:hypothetical protein